MFAATRADCHRSVQKVLVRGARVDNKVGDNPTFRRNSAYVSESRWQRHPFSLSVLSLLRSLGVQLFFKYEQVSVEKLEKTINEHSPYPHFATSGVAPVQTAGSLSTMASTRIVVNVMK